MSPVRLLIQHNLSQMMKGIKTEQATDMKDITHHAHHATMWAFCNGQPAACPHHYIVSERAKEHQHVLCLEALFIALGQTQPLLVALEGGFDAPTTPIIKGDIGQQARDGISSLRSLPPQHREHLLDRQRANQHAVSEGAVNSATAHGNALDRTDITGRWLAHPAKRTLGPVWVLDPGGDCPRQPANPLSRILLRYHLIASGEQPIEVVQGPSTSIHTDDRACPGARIQVQRRLCRLHQMDIACKEAIDDHFLILGGQDAPHLSPPAMVLSSKVTLGRKRGFGATWQAAHVHIQQLETGLVVVLKALTVRSVDLIKRLVQLDHIFGGAGIQRLLHHRLLSTAHSSKGSLQAWIGAQAGIDFHQTVGSGQQADKRIRELVDGRMLDGFLPDLHLSADRAKEIQMTQFRSYGGQRGARAKMVRRWCDRLVHGDAPSHASELASFMRSESSLFLCLWQARLLRDNPAATLGET